jgi:uncharacterized membrane protein YphA (DoxX/SURF4 family)
VGAVGLRRIRLTQLAGTSPAVRAVHTADPCYAIDASQTFYLRQEHTMTPSIPTTRPAPATANALVSRLCLLLLCSAYLQGGIVKAFDFPGAVAEMQHFGLAPALPFALLTIAGEIGASILVVAGIRRWLGATFLGLFTLMATMLANRFWELSGPGRMALENGFFEHLGLAGAFFLVAWLDYHTPVRMPRA